PRQAHGGRDERPDPDRREQRVVHRARERLPARADGAERVVGPRPVAPGDRRRPRAERDRRPDVRHGGRTLGVERPAERRRVAGGRRGVAARAPVRRHARAVPVVHPAAASARAVGESRAHDAGPRERAVPGADLRPGVDPRSGRAAGLGGDQRDHGHDALTVTALLAPLVAAVLAGASTPPSPANAPAATTSVTVTDSFVAETDDEAASEMLVKAAY